MKIACISDIHGNLYALEKALKIIDALNIDEVIFMGDAVGYIPGVQVLKCLKKLNITCMMGNHENMLLNKSYSAKKDTVYLHSKTLKKAENYNLEYINSWKSEFYQDNIAFFHGSPSDSLNGYIYPDTDISNFTFNKNIKYCVMGHTHRPFIREYNNITFINNGSIGMPRDDGIYGAFSIIDTKNEIAKIIRFDITKETKRSINEFGPVHSSVSSLIKRHAKNDIVGEIYNV